MDLLKDITGGAQGQQQQGQGQGGQQQQGGGGFNLGNTLNNLTSGGNMGDKLNEMGGGGKQGEANEDYLDKAVDFAQERFMNQGPQDNETAAENAKDEVISDMIREKYKGVTGSDFPIPDKDIKYGA